MSHEQYQSCIKECYACATECDHCATACLAEPDVANMARCIQLDLDCAEVCRMAAAWMARGSEFAGRICQLCAEVCEACAQECTRHPAQHCQRCADACRRCAAECRKMAGMGQGGQSAAASNNGATLPPV